MHFHAGYPIHAIVHQKANLPYRIEDDHYEHFDVGTMVLQAGRIVVAFRKRRLVTFMLD